MTSRTSLLSGVSPDESPKFYQEHGYFVEDDQEIGEVVVQLFNERRSRDPNGLNRFRQRLIDLPRIRKILEPYALTPVKVFPWGTTPADAFYATSHLPYNPYINIFAITPKTRLVVRDGSQMLDSKGVKSDIGMARIPDPYLTDFPTIDIEMEQGGVIVMHPRLSLGSEGRSIIYSLPEKKREERSGS